MKASLSAFSAWPTPAFPRQRLRNLVVGVQAAKLAHMLDIGLGEAAPVTPDA